MTDALAAWLCHNGKPEAALAISMSFAAFLLASEVCALTAADLAFPSDLRLRLPGNSAAGVAIWNAKTGRNQFATVDDALLMRRLRRFAGTRRPTASLFGLSYPRLDRLYREGLPGLGLQNVGYTFHSLRHGGATNALLERRRFEGIKTEERWESDKSCRRYLNAGKALLLSADVPAAANNGISRLSGL